MKHIYLILLLVVSFSMSAQETYNVSNEEHTEITGFKLYPNPVYDGVVYISSDNRPPRDIIVYDVFGEIVLRERIFTKRLNVSRLVPGVYVVKVLEGNKSLTRKLVVK